MDTYVTKAGDMVDQICWRHYGKVTGTVEIVLKANPGLAEFGPILPDSLTVSLPKIQPIPDKSTIKLWD